MRPVEGSKRVSPSVVLPQPLTNNTYQFSFMKRKTDIFNCVQVACLLLHSRCLSSDFQQFVLTASYHTDSPGIVLLSGLIETMALLRIRW